jgi:hypothetical protein
MYQHLFLDVPDMGNVLNFCVTYFDDLMARLDHGSDLVQAELIFTG